MFSTTSSSPLQEGWDQDTLTHDMHTPVPPRSSFPFIASYSDPLFHPVTPYQLNTSNYTLPALPMPPSTYDSSHFVHEHPPHLPNDTPTPAMHLPPAVSSPLASHNVVPFSALSLASNPWNSSSSRVPSVAPPRSHLSSKPLLSPAHIDSPRSRSFLSNPSPVISTFTSDSSYVYVPSPLRHPVPLSSHRAPQAPAWNVASAIPAVGHPGGPPFFPGSYGGVLGGQVPVPHAPPLPPPPPLPPRPLPPPFAPPAAPPPAPPTEPKPLSPPTLTHIPILKSKDDYLAWENGVISTIRLLDLYGHLLDPAAPPSYTCHEDRPQPPPPWPANPTLVDVYAARRWSLDDMTVCYILRGRLGEEARCLLPPANAPGHLRTAFLLYDKLAQFYGVRDFEECAELLDAALLSSCDPNKVHEYVARWNSAVTTAHSNGQAGDIRTHINHMVHGLPSGPTFSHLRNSLNDQLKCMRLDDISAFYAVSRSILKAINAFKPSAFQRTLASNRARMTSASTHNSSQRTSAATATTSTAASAEASAPSRPTCSNCNIVGHTIATCYKPGGGQEKKKSGPRAFVAQFTEGFLDSLANFDEEQLSCLPGHTSGTAPPSPYGPDSPSAFDVASDPSVPPVLPSVAAFCIPTNTSTSSTYVPPNPITEFSLYSACMPSSSCVPFAFISTPTLRDLPYTAYVSLTAQYNALLDSGCTHHLFSDRSLFENLDESDMVDIGTANCGTMRSRGSGTVSFRYTYKGCSIVMRLTDCLWVPDVPIGLLSVGAFLEKGVDSYFDSITHFTYLIFNRFHRQLPGYTMTADQHHRLSFMKLDFVRPAPAAVVSAMPAVPVGQTSFPRLSLTPELWHRRFGHPGQDTTRALLTKDYATGIEHSGTLSFGKCVACIIGKAPQQPYATPGNRASRVGELLHMDGCGPFALMSFSRNVHIAIVLDDCSNWGFQRAMTKKTEVTEFVKRIIAFLVRFTGLQVLTLRCDNALEFIQGNLGKWLSDQGIVVQKTAPYAHSQNGKAERYIRTLEERTQTLLAASGLSMAFYEDGFDTSVYLANREPTSTLPPNTTPFEVLNKKKPDLSHLRVWGCQCFVFVPKELRKKGDLARYEAIFVGYDEHRVGWRVRRPNGTHGFSRDVIFNEDMSGRFAIPRSVAPGPSLASASAEPAERVLRPQRTRTRTEAGHAYDELLALRRGRSSTKNALLAERIVDGAVNGGDCMLWGVDVGPGCDICVRADGSIAVRMNERRADVKLDVVRADVTAGAVERRAEDSILRRRADVTDLTLTSYLASFAAVEDIPLSTNEFHVEYDTLLDFESSILWEYPPPLASSCGPTSIAFVAHGKSRSKPWDISKAPSSYAEAIARPDSASWIAAMQREMDSLGPDGMHAFEEADLPPGESTVGLKWVFQLKTDADGVRIAGKEKARVVAQGFSQRASQFDETYAPVARTCSVRTVLAFAAAHDWEIRQFDCKTAFLHAKLRHAVFARPFPGWKVNTPGKVLRIRVALYGLRQSAYEFYTFLMSLFLDLGLTRCDADHGVFIGTWTSPPDPAISMPSDGSPLRLIVPLHVDDGLGVTNSVQLYDWFIKSLATKLLIVDLGDCAKFLSMLIIRDRIGRRLWLSSHVYIAELLDEWNLTSCKTAKTPLPSHPPQDADEPIKDFPAEDLTLRYQRIVGCLMYLAVATRPDIAFASMWLGQYSSAPLPSHFRLAKHVLRYLAGTKHHALTLGAASPSTPESLGGFMRANGCTDADWASDARDRKSISGYAFFYLGSLVSWSAVKQKSIALSSTEAEYYAMSHAFKEALWFCVFLRSMDFPIPRPFPILCDNQAALALSDSPSISRRSKHIDIRHHFLREHIKEGSFVTNWIPTHDMPADIFTKSLPHVTFIRHRDVLGLSIPPLYATS